VGHTAWLAAHAARSGARADLVGRDAATAARRSLPRSMERGLRVERARGGLVRVSVPVPLLRPGRRAPVRVGAAASLGGER
jgi:hypothetical protein